MKFDATRKANAIRYARIVGYRAYKEGCSFRTAQYYHERDEIMSEAFLDEPAVKIMLRDRVKKYLQDYQG